LCQGKPQGPEEIEFQERSLSADSPAFHLHPPETRHDKINEFKAFRFSGEENENFTKNSVDIFPHLVYFSQNKSRFCLLANKNVVV